MAKSKKIDKKVVAKKAKPAPVKAAAKPQVKLSAKPAKPAAKPTVAKKQQPAKSKPAGKSDSKQKVAAKAPKAAKVAAVGKAGVKTPAVKATAKETSVKATAGKLSAKELKKQAKETKPVKELKKDAKKDSSKEDKKLQGKKVASGPVLEKEVKANVKAKGKEKPGKAKKAKEEEDDDFVDPFDLIDGDDELAGIEIEAYLETDTNEEFNLNVAGDEIIEEEVFLTDADGNRLCKIKDCDDIATTDGHCRYHYLLFWRKIQLRRKILAGGKLDKYIEELTSRYPDKYLEVLRKDLATEKNFLAALSELEIEDAGDTDLPDESEELIEEVRGSISHTGTGDDDSF